MRNDGDDERRMVMRKKKGVRLLPIASRDALKRGEDDEAGAQERLSSWCGGFGLPWAGGRGER